MLGDGGFSVVGDENRQEYLSRQLILCQAIVALATLQPGGIFCLKLFDTHLPFTVHLLHVLRRHFKQFALLKPNQSRPANSERYVLCQGMLQQKPAVVEYLFAVNDVMNGGGSGNFGPTKQVSLGGVKKSGQSGMGGVCTPSILFRFHLGNRYSGAVSI